MNMPNKSFSIAECKIQASILLKSLRSHDLTVSDNSAKRFQRLHEFNKLSIQEIKQADVKRKHALQVIAIEKGFATWADLKCQSPFICGGFLNHWFVTYAEAKSYQNLNNGFLLSFKKQFFICDADYINHLGLDAKDDDWKLINYDWVKPTHQQAWQRLYKKWMKMQEKN